MVFQQISIKSNLNVLYITFREISYVEECYGNATQTTESWPERKTSHSSKLLNWKYKHKVVIVANLLYDCYLLAPKTHQAYLKHILTEICNQSWPVLSWKEYDSVVCQLFDAFLWYDQFTFPRIGQVVIFLEIISYLKAEMSPTF